MAEWIAAIAAAVSVIGAGFAWWRANLSKQARVDAQAARDAALIAQDTAWRHLEETRKQVGEMQRIADAMEGSPLETQRVNDGLWMLRNKTSNPIEVAELVDGDVIPVFDFETPFVLQPYATREMGIMVSGAYAAPDNIVLRITGRPDPLHVPLARV